MAKYRIEKVNIPETLHGIRKRSAENVSAAAN
jgi:hypothetical protein